MSDDKTSDEAKKNAEIEREILASRGYSLADAIGRMGGENLLKGTSPVPKKHQAEIEVQRYLERNLIDGAGSLEIVLTRRYETSEIVLGLGYDSPLQGLVTMIEHFLAHEERLQDFVNEIDRQWGRNYLERPHFETPGRAPDSDDPYTFASVRTKLEKLCVQIRTDGATKLGDR